MSLKTTAPMPTTAPSPIVTPDRIRAFDATQTSEPTTISPRDSSRLAGILPPNTLSSENVVTALLGCCPPRTKVDPLAKLQYLPTFSLAPNVRTSGQPCE